MSKLSIGRAWAESTAFLRAERRILVPLVLAMLALPGALMTLVTPADERGMPLTLADRPSPGGWMLVVLAMLALMLIGQLALSRLALGWHGSLGEALGHGLRRFVPMFVANLLLAFGIAVPLVVILGLFALGGPVGIKLGLVLLVAPLLLLFVRASLLLPVAAAEAAGPVAILRRAFALTRGAVLRLFGFAVLFIVTAVVVATAISTVVGAIVLVLIGKPDAWTVAATLLALVGGLVQGVTVGLWTVMLARIYAQLAQSPVAA